MNSEYSIEDIIKAKRIAREAGYKVTPPGNDIERAKNIVRANGYRVCPPDPTEVAIKVARQAGYGVLPPENHVENNPPANTVPPQEADKTPNAPVKTPNAPVKTPNADPQQNKPEYSWSERQAAKYL